MSNKKERMLNHIQSNVGWFMTTSVYKVIPYTELSRSLFNTAQASFAGGAVYENVVCLISTSVWSDGKSGILFTTQNVYTKAWGGLLTSSYKNPLSDGYFATFSSNFNEFDTDRMKELIWDLYTISEDEDEKERKRQEAAQRLKQFGEIGTALGELLLAGMLTVETVSFVTNLLVESNNEKLKNEINDVLSDLDLDFDSD